MNIQSNINQALSIAGLLATQSPMAAKRKEAKVLEAQAKQHEAALEREEADLTKVYEGTHKASEAAMKGPKGRPSNIATRIDPLAREIEAGRKLQEKFPTEEREIELLKKEETLSGYKQKEEKRIAEQKLEQERLAKSRELQDIILKGGATNSTEQATIAQTRGTLDVEKAKADYEKKKKKEDTK